MDQYKCEEVPVNKMLDLNKNNVRKARDEMAPIFHTVNLCECQNISLQGQRHSWKNQSEPGESGLVGIKHLKIIFGKISKITLPQRLKKI